MLLLALLGCGTNESQPIPIDCPQSASLRQVSYVAGKVPLPERSPADFVKFGCDITQHDDEGAERWPLWVFVDLRDISPDKSSDNTCAQNHSWCDLYSIQATRTKALKDCDSWMKALKKAFRKAK